MAFFKSGEGIPKNKVAAKTLNPLFLSFEKKRGVKFQHSAPISPFLTIEEPVKNFLYLRFQKDQKYHKVSPGLTGKNNILPRVQPFLGETPP